MAKVRVDDPSGGEESARYALEQEALRPDWRADTDRRRNEALQAQRQSRAVPANQRAAVAPNDSAVRVARRIQREKSMTMEEVNAERQARIATEMQRRSDAVAAAIVEIERKRDPRTSAEKLVGAKSHDRAADHPNRRGNVPAIPRRTGNGGDVTV